MFLSKLLLINLIAVRLGCLVATCLQRAAPGCVVEELAGNRGIWCAHCMTGGVFLVRRRHVDHPHHDRARRYMPFGPGAVFSFGVRGGRVAGRAFIESVRLCSHLANVGDARTLVIHPGSTTHQQLTETQLRECGVPADLVRISVGLEDVDDILWDLDLALTTATKGTR